MPGVFSANVRPRLPANHSRPGRNRLESDALRTQTPRRCLERPQVQGRAQIRAWSRIHPERRTHRSWNVSPQPAEHVHGASHGADVRRDLRSRPRVVAGIGLPHDPIDFEVAITAFDDPYALIAPDEKHSTSDEIREWLIGDYMKNSKDFPFDKARRVTDKEVSSARKAIEEKTSVSAEER